MLLALLAACSPAGAPESAPDKAGPPGPAADALTEPTVLASEGGRLEATLTVAEQEVKINGNTVRARVCNGSFVAPTLEVSPGKTHPRASGSDSS